MVETTPPDLYQEGIYRKIAVPFHAKPYRDVSIALLAKALGAVPTHSNVARALHNGMKRTPTKNLCQDANPSRPRLPLPQSVTCETVMAPMAPLPVKSTAACPSATPSRKVRCRPHTFSACLPLF